MRKTVFLVLPLVLVAISVAQNTRRSSQKESASAHLPPAAICQWEIAASRSHYAAAQWRASAGQCRTHWADCSR